MAVPEAAAAARQMEALVQGTVLASGPAHSWACGTGLGVLEGTPWVHGGQTGFSAGVAGLAFHATASAGMTPQRLSKLFYGC